MKRDEVSYFRMQADRHHADTGLRSIKRQVHLRPDVASQHAVKLTQSQRRRIASAGKTVPQHRSRMSDAFLPGRLVLLRTWWYLQISTS